MDPASSTLRDVLAFSRRGGALCAEGLPLASLAAQFGTPTFVYSRAAIESACASWEDALSDLPHHLCFAVKANSNLALLGLLARLGLEFDAGSLGELMRLLALGVPGRRIIVSGVGKRDDEIEAALRADVLYLSVESESELAAVSRIARALGTKARVSLRVNPDIDAQTHPYIATGLRENKFGIPLSRAVDVARAARADPALEVCGVSCHLGSQIASPAPFVTAAEQMSALVGELSLLDLPLRSVGLGGGFAIPYSDELMPSIAEYTRSIAPVIRPLGLTLVLEPGRAIVGGAAVLLTRVVRRKRGADREFVIVDAGMNDLIRPALYGAQHTIEAVNDRGGGEEVVDVVGPVCETADTFARSLSLPRLEEGDLLAIHTAGAYGLAMSSTYNGRPLAAEVLVSQGKAQIIRERAAVTELWRGERLLDGTRPAAVLGEETS